MLRAAALSGDCLRGLWAPGVFVGTVFLIVCYFRARAGSFTTDAHIGFEAAAWYWHFVDVVWVFLYINVYWWGAASFGHLQVN